MKSKCYQLWEFTTTGENVVASSNDFKYLEKKAENLDCIYCYIYDVLENKTHKI